MSESQVPEITLGTNRSFQERLIGALKLDASVYEEVEHDDTAMGQAATVVALAAVAEGLGRLTEAGAPGLFGGVVSGFLGWGFGAAVVWLVGVKAMNCTSNMPELLRALGFASAPKLILVIGILPIGPLRGLIVLAAGILTLVAYVLAARQALDTETGRAVVVCILAAVVSFAIAMVLGTFAAACA